MLFPGGNTATLPDTAVGGSLKTQSCWGFQHENWHAECLQKYIVPGRLCAAILSVKGNHAAKINSTMQPGNDESGNDESGNKTLTKGHMERIAKFCLYLLDEILSEHQFYWDDVTTLRIHVASSLTIYLETLSLIFSSAFKEFAEMNPKTNIGTEPIFNLVPVLGAGRSATSMDDILTCELFAMKT